MKLSILVFTVFSAFAHSAFATPPEDQKGSCDNLLNAFTWPADNSMADPIEFYQSMKPRFSNLGIKRLRAKKLVWPGPLTYQRQVYPESYEYTLSPESLTYHNERDRKPLDMFIQVAFRMGMEQGRRIAFQNQILPAFRALIEAQVKLKEQQNRQSIAMELISIAHLMRSHPQESFKSFPMNSARDGQVDWPSHARPAAYKDLARVLKNIFLQMYTVKNDEQLESLLIYVLKSGAEQIWRNDTATGTSRTQIASYADEAFQEVMRTDIKTYNQLPEILDIYFSGIGSLIVQGLFREVNVDPESILIL